MSFEGLWSGLVVFGGYMEWLRKAHKSIQWWIRRVCGNWREGVDGRKWVSFVGQLRCLEFV